MQRRNLRGQCVVWARHNLHRNCDRDHWSALHRVVLTVIRFPGPMSRYAEDLIPMLKILLEPTLTIDLKLDIPVNLRNIKLYYMKDDGGNPIVSPVNNELIEAQKNVVKTWNDMFGVNYSLMSAPVFLEIKGTGIWDDREREQL